MKRFVEINKKDKKAKKAYYSQFRNTWGDINPVMRVIPNKKKNAKETGDYGNRENDPEA